VARGGVVIGRSRFVDYIPLCRDVKGNDVISQYRWPAERSRPAQMDFLGLKTLTVIEDAGVDYEREPEFH